MEERRCRTLKSCKQKMNKSSMVDRLSLLPDETLLMIWSHLTMEEAARTCLVSRMCKHMWLFHPRLNFYFERQNRIRNKYGTLMLQRRSTFIDRVDNILKHHLGSVIHEFKIDFDMLQQNEAHIDDWLVFAFAKQVKTLELESWTYSLKMPIQYQVSSNFGTFKPALTSLCLVCIHLAPRVIESFLDSFPSLEILCIRNVHSITSITTPSPLRLKHLELSNCGGFDSIDLYVPHLLSFTCEGQPTTLHFRNASSLSAVSIGTFLIGGFIANTIECLLNYCVQLEYLELKSNLYQRNNWQVNGCPVFTNVKHLALNIVPPVDYISIWASVVEGASVLGWTPVIKACPLLEKLTLKLEPGAPPNPRFRRRYPRKLDAHPLRSLKTLEIIGFLAHCDNLELVKYVIENADMLEEIIIDDMSPYLRGRRYSSKVRSIDLESRQVALSLQQTLPPTLKLIFRSLPFVALHQVS